jgi:hypothetical protein
MAVNTTSSPYYDDFDQTKNFYRILFKPGTAVQARELTQIQSILQDQIKKFANHIFVDGSRTLKDSPVSVSINKDVRAIKIQPTSANIYSYLNKYVTGAASNTIGQVVAVYPIDTPNLGDPATIIINLKKIENDGIFTGGETIYFYNTIGAAANTSASSYSEITLSESVVSAIVNTVDVSDEITLLSSSGTIAEGDKVYGQDDLYVVKVLSSTVVLLNRNFGSTGSGISLSFVRQCTSKTLIVSCSSGAYYKNGFFIQVKNQSVVPQKYSAYPTKSVILRYNESIQNYRDDNSLLDPSFGSSNYLAPGADRLKITLDIDSVDLTVDKKPDVTDSYIEIARFINGNVDFLESPSDSAYAGLNQILADRTYTEAGNFSVSSFSLENSGSTSDDKNIKYYISPGEAYIGGFDVATVGKTELLVPKARTTKSETNISVNTYYGNYIIINAPQFGLPYTDTINLYDYYECHSTTDRNAMGAGTLIGYVVPKHIQYENGYGSTATFRFYWYYYAQASLSKTPANIKSIIGVSNSISAMYGNGGTYATPTFFATVNSAKGLVDGALQIFEPSQHNKLVFPLGRQYPKTLTNNRVTYRKTYKGVSVSGSSVTITATSPDKFVGGPGVLSSSIKREYYTFVVTSVISGTVSNGVFVPLDDTTVTLNADQTQLTINFGADVGSGTVDIMATLENDVLPRRTKTLVQNYGTRANILLTDTPYSLFNSDIYRLNGVFKIGSNSYIGAYDSGTAYTSNSVVLYNGIAYQAVTTNANQLLTNSTYWKKLPAESLVSYVLDDGQRDDYYDHGMITYVGDDNYAPGNVLISYDYFSHSGTGAFDAQSYPASLYSTIPNYKSQTDGQVISLRDALDYRPTRKYSASINPNFGSGRISNVELFDNYIKPNPTSVSSTQIDIEYYLGRIDRLYVQNRNANTQGSYFLLDQGTPGVIPKVPNDKSSKDTQLIATIGVNPYTATANDVKIVYANFPRYTMNDVYNIDKRLTSLEKTVKKNSIDIVALNNKVFDRNGTTGNILYTTGILVDDFSGYGSSYIASPYFTAAVDPIRKECRPAFSAHVYNLFFATTPTGVSTLNDLTVFNYTEESFVDQSIASGTLLEVNPAGIVNTAGRATIYPSTINTNGGGNSTVDLLAKMSVEAIPAALLTDYIVGTYGTSIASAGVSLAGSQFAVSAGLDLAFEDIASATILGSAGAAALAVDYAYNKIPIVKNVVKGAENLVTSVFKGLGLKF